MELKQIEYFELTCRHKSISKAAAAMYVSQQGVSKQIANLENELGARLFVRSSRGVELTEDGQFFHEQAKKILAIQKELTAHFSSRKERTTPIFRIGVSHGLEAFFNEQFFSGFSEQNRDLRVQVFSMWNPLTDDNISCDGIDAGFTLAPVRQQGLHLEPVLKLPLTCIVNVKSPLAGRESVTLNDVLDFTVALADENYNSFYGFLALCKERKRKPKMVKKFDLLSIYDYVDRHTDAVGFTLDAYRSSVRYPNVEHIPINDPDAFWNICLAWKEENRSKITDAFVSYTRQYLTERNLP